MDTGELQLLGNTAAELMATAASLTTIAFLLKAAMEQPDGEATLYLEGELQNRIASLRCSIVASMRRMTDSERLIIMSSFCAECGSMDPRCQCWNDE